MNKVTNEKLIKRISEERMKRSGSERTEVLRSRLSKLVERYGMELTCAATGWKASSINQYLRNNRSRINAEKLDTARELLKEFA